MPTNDDAALRISPPADAGEWHAAHELLAEYIHTLQDDISADYFETELADLHAMYSVPRATFLLAWADDVLAGCCALLPCDDSDHLNAAEMRRLYVRPAFRGLGLGRQLTQQVMDFARQEGFESVLLDTLNAQEVAREMYRHMGFYEIEPWYNSPLRGAHFLKVDLWLNSRFSHSGPAPLL